MVCFADIPQTIRVGIFQLEPLNFTDKYGQAQGLFPDLLREMVREEDSKLVFVPGTWKECLERLENGGIDLITTIVRSPERELKYDFIQESVVDNWSQVFSPANADIKSFQDLDGKNVAIVEGDINGKNFLKLADSMDLSPQILRFEHYVDIFKAVQDGKADVLVSAQHFGFRHANEYGLVATSLQFSPKPIYIAALKGQQASLLDHIDRHLARWKEDQNSYYYERLAYWISGQKEKEIIPLWIIVLATVCIILVIVLIIRNHSIRQAERKHKEEEKQRDLILEKTAIDGFCKLAPNGRFLQVNDAYVEMIGYSRDELLRMSIQDVEAESGNDATRRHIEQAVNTGSNRFLTRHRTKSGELLDLDVSTSYYPGESPAFYSFLNNTTELQKTKKDLDRMFNYSVDMLCIAHPDGYFLKVNPSWEATLGWTDEELLEKPWLDFVHPDDFQTTIQAGTVLAKGQPIIGFENRYLCKDGSYRWLSWNTFPLQEEGLLLAIARDITVSKQKAEKLQQLEEQLRHSQKMEAIGTLAGGIAHDFNNILTPVIAHANLARRKLDPENPLRHHIEQIEISVQRAADLVKQILSINRKSLSIDTITDLRTILQEVCTFIRASFPATIDIDLKLGEDPLPVAADPTQIHQVVLNLCTNAKDAMAQTGGTLSLSADRLEENGKAQIHLIVSDTGTGIPENIQGRIFDPYFTTKKIGKGSGLGLAVIHGIVTSLQGSVTVDSQPGQGTRFDIILPATDNTHKAPVTRSGEVIYGSGEHILLVDDEEAIINSVKLVLTDLNYRVTAYSSSFEALAAFKKAPEQFDAILTDQTMPELTGIDLAQQIAKVNPDLPILLSTGYTEGVNQETVHHYGITKLLYKPYEMEVLADEFARLFAKS